MKIASRLLTLSLALVASINADISDDLKKGWQKTKQVAAQGWEKTKEVGAKIIDPINVPKYKKLLKEAEAKLNACSAAQCGGSKDEKCLIVNCQQELARVRDIKSKMAKAGAIIGISVAAGAVAAAGAAAAGGVAVKQQMDKKAEYQLEVDLQVIVDKYDLNDQWVRILLQKRNKYVLNPDNLALILEKYAEKAGRSALSGSDFFKKLAQYVGYTENQLWKIYTAAYPYGEITVLPADTKFKSIEERKYNRPAEQKATYSE